MHRLNGTSLLIITLIINGHVYSDKTSHVNKEVDIILPIKSGRLKEDRGKVVGIKDGDTFELLVAGRRQVVRLAHIDCPEKKQPFGAKAKLYASKLCFGKQVSVIHNSKYDRNKRLIAEIIVEGYNVNRELVRVGLAWHFKKYSNDIEYARLEQNSRHQRKGLWSVKDPIAPWQWRKTKH